MIVMTRIEMKIEQVIFSHVSLSELLYLKISPWFCLLLFSLPYIDQAYLMRVSLLYNLHS